MLWQLRGGAASWIDFLEMLDKARAVCLLMAVHCYIVAWLEYWSYAKLNLELVGFHVFQTKRPLVV